MKLKGSSFPVAALVVIIFQFCLKVCHVTLTGVLPLYFVDVLHSDESNATVMYHTYTLLVSCFSMIGGMLSDSYFGRFKSILYFTIVFVIGLIVLSISAIPPLNLPISELTILGLIIVAFGFGAMRPCVIAFGGDQFVLPQQAKQLSLLFVLICVASNVASISSSFIMPILRKDITCFEQLTCYSLVFVVPAAVIAIGAVLILSSKQLFRILKPIDNVIFNVTRCVCYAMYRKIKSKEKKDHWLNYAADKYESELIEDIKSVLQVLKLFIPLPMYWSLHTMQTSTWTFQASRMDGEFAGYLIKPDQIQAASPLFVLIFIPIFHYFVYPVLARFFFINTYLKRITLGCFTLALAYYISGIVELRLERTYADSPVKGLAQLRIFNTLDCDVPITLGSQKFKVKELNMWQNLTIPVDGKMSFKYIFNFESCRFHDDASKEISGNIELMENKATSYASTKRGLSYKFTDNVEKAMSGNPLIRTLINIDNNGLETYFKLNIVHKNKTLHSLDIPKKLKESSAIEVAHKIYDLYVNDHLVESNVTLKLGGVYTVIGHISNTKIVARTVTVTTPNSLHILWILPQQMLFSMCEIMVDVLVMDFAFSQAPTSMKTLVQSSWLFLSFFGNIIVIAITKAHFFERKAFEIFFYAILMTISSVIFAILAAFYKYRDVSVHSEEQSKDVPADKKQ